ncbi:MAG: methylenetetrahydrofolate reductase [NAD(P)H] [Deltaproteobacteria bacterium]|nr:methylenetetrahydrofolate reductase [NAD(P)H] [Deltaproteobacteria bacterium]NIS76332.1 methylenetetrahydrofolate reductase [NAD(P)H] [Deltaproteobacteria bacterium]
MKIRDLFREKRTLLSFEFFPPKNPESEHILDETVSILSRFNPDFVSVTFGAGGSTRDRTLDWTLRIKEHYHLNVMMHLTCIASSLADIQEIIKRLKWHGIENVLALRGDPPKDFPRDKIKRHFQYAYELVEYLRELDTFSIGVAGYPEGHIEAVSIEKDLEYLKMKVDAGAHFIITQLFFENSYFYEFINRAAQQRIAVPIIPGLMPIVNIKQVKKFTDMCGATVPDRIMADMQDKDSADMLKTGVDYAISQCRELLEFGVDGLHFYTLNRNTATEQILNEIEGTIRD